MPILASYLLDVLLSAGAIFFGTWLRNHPEKLNTFFTLGMLPLTKWSRLIARAMGQFFRVFGLFGVLFFLVAMIVHVVRR
jgi:hypothetical protein